MDRLLALDTVRDILLIIFTVFVLYVLLGVLPVLMDHANAIEFYTKNCPRFG